MEMREKGRGIGMCLGWELGLGYMERSMGEVGGDSESGE